MSSNVKTVSQALRRIKELKGQINVVTSRLQRSFAWAESDSKIDASLDINIGKPTYDFYEVRDERAKLVDELINLKTKLAVANATTRIDFEGRRFRMQEAVFFLAELKSELEFVKGLAGREGVYRIPLNVNRFTPGPAEYVDVTYHVAVTERDRDQAVKFVGERITALNAVIEDANHRTDLPEG